MKPLTARASATMLVCLAAAVAPVASAQTHDAFPDVPPCHWAAEAVHRIGAPVDANTSRARASQELTANAARQVFEGLRCGEPEWSERFLLGPPADWPPDIAVHAFALEVVELRRSGDEAEADVALSVTLADGTTLERSGTVGLAFGEGEWRASYESLAALDLPIFP